MRWHSAQLWHLVNCSSYCHPVSSFQWGRWGGGGGRAVMITLSRVMYNIKKHLDTY